MLLVIQMQGADFDFTNTDSYGHGPPPATPASGYTALNTTGRYEYVMATSGVTAGSVDISGLGAGAGLVYSYTSAAATGTAGQRRFQVLRVPQYTTATTSNTLTAAPWNGTVGGVLALDTTGALTLSGTVSLDGLGFRGAPGIQRGGAAGLANTDRVTSATLAANGNKAEGIAGTPVGTSAGNGYPGGDAARGAPGNAGGGGTDGRPSNNDQNSGGGGGGNGGDGGQGGNTWSSNLPRGGYGGVQLPIGPARVFLGGGGGSGSTNNSNNPNASGAAGGGMALIRAGSISGARHRLGQRCGRLQPHPPRRGRRWRRGRHHRPHLPERFAGRCHAARQRWPRRKRLGHAGRRWQRTRPWWRWRRRGHHHLQRTDVDVSDRRGQRHHHHRQSQLRSDPRNGGLHIHHVALHHPRRQRRC